MKKVILGAISLLLFFLLQTTIFKHFAINNIGPNLLIILCCTFGFMYGEKEGLIMGFIAGLLCDIFFGSIIGFNALLYMFVGYFNGKFNRLFYPEDIVLPGTLFLGSDIFFGLAFYVLNFLLRGRLKIGYYLLNVIMPEAIYTLVCAIALYPLLLLCINKQKRSEQRSTRKFV